MNRKTIIAFYLIFSVLCLPVLWLICWHHGETAAISWPGSLGGPTEPGYNPVDILWWLLLFTPVWGVCGGLFSTGLCTARYVLPRYGRLRRWWFFLIGRIMAVNLLYFVLLTIINIFCFPKSAALENMDAPMTFSLVRISVILWAHSSAMIAIMIWIVILSQQHTMALFFILVIQALGKIPVIMGCPPALNPLVWGMYGYSTDCMSAGGFSPGFVLIAEILCILSAAVLPLFKKSFILRSVGL